MEAKGHMPIAESSKNVLLKGRKPESDIRDLIF